MTPIHGLSTSAPTESAMDTAADDDTDAIISKRRSVSECSVLTISSMGSAMSSGNSDRSSGSPSISESGEITSTLSNIILSTKTCWLFFLNQHCNCGYIIFYLFSFHFIKIQVKKVAIS